MTRTYCLLKDDDVIKGLIAAEEDLFLGEKALYINEIIVGEAYRGKGLALDLIGGLLCHTDATFVLCFIESENGPSIHTALKSGQKVFTQECV